MSRLRIFTPKFRTQTNIISIYSETPNTETNVTSIQKIVVTVRTNFAYMIDLLYQTYKKMD